MTAQRCSEEGEEWVSEAHRLVKGGTVGSCLEGGDQESGGGERAPERPLSSADL